jgi:transcriptional regulator with XRE-family HTH domain
MRREELKRRRIEMGLSQTNLRRLLGLSMRTIIRYERGHSEIPLDVQMALDNLASIQLLRRSNRSLSPLRSLRYRTSSTDSNAGQRQKVLLSVPAGLLIVASQGNDRSRKCSRVFHQGGASGAVSRRLRKKGSNNGFSRSRIKLRDYARVWAIEQR